MNPHRRRWLCLLAGGGLAWAPLHAAGDAVQRGRPLRFPRDHGAHTGSRIEWWYATGVLHAAGHDAPIGFQVTFFRSRTGLAVNTPGRFAARQLLFAHAAVSDIAAQKHHHAERIARWSGSEDAQARARASSSDTDVALNGWSLRRAAANIAPGANDNAGSYNTSISSPAFTLDLELTPTQPVLLQGEAGFSQKGPQPQQASHYYSQPQLQAAGRLRVSGANIGGGRNDGAARNFSVRGRAWIDHEWSDEVLPPLAVGWDWIGFNLDDGSALTAFRLRRADGSTLWAGGSFRAAAATASNAAAPFAADAVRFVPGRRWTSPASNAAYPVEWQVDSPAGQYQIRALMDHQELDSRGATGTVYWEGLSELLDSSGRRVGLGYLEMTGYAGALKL